MQDVPVTLEELSGNRVEINYEDGETETIQDVFTSQKPHAKLKKCGLGKPFWNSSPWRSPVAVNPSVQSSARMSMT